MSEKPAGGAYERALDALLAEAAAKAAGVPAPKPAGRTAGPKGPPGGAVPADPVVSARALGRSVGQDAVHAERVAELATSLWSQLGGGPSNEALHAWASERAGVLLKVASLVHDVGLSVGYAKHHKHSYTIIKAWQWSGLTENEVEVVANLARYHRRSGPKLRHASFAALSDAERGTVGVLAGILRVADALDGSGRNPVTGVRIGRDAGVLVLEIWSPLRPSAEMLALRAKGGLLERALGVTLRARWAGRPDGAG